ncbi:nucleotidyltransferase [Alkalihalobacterium chitinilyticum]|uniref:tRNA(Met) cytidine acetate ligase n=1 Tax=Alkalihalobacterium chitinilyticum TaxID=2980103 RepID=A0ABT5VC97_9BACI|nr:nucleotidyltransferase [Alkalihalobacterium chitinilyticum]MDE5413078.1 nucleotidyltransferase [Alkalihalobacterium chitinilyticum]
MKAVGVVVEYNPFHNGHLFHLEESRRVTEGDVVIAVMSGNFLQRGEPAIVSKWQRTKMALASGVDIVLELPYAYSTQKAEIFAFGSISILQAIGVEEVCFGSEAGNIDLFHELYEFINKNKQHFNEQIQFYMSQGNSYPKATSLAFSSMKGKQQQLLDLSQPNNILGYHYVEAIHLLGNKMKGKTIQRKSAQYHDESFASETIASATSIRKAIFNKSANQKGTIHQVMPKSTLDLLTYYETSNHTLHDWELYFPMLKYQILSSTEAELAEIYEGEEGLEFRLKRFINTANSFAEFMHSIKTKRYTWNRLQRYCLHILTNTKKADMQWANAKNSPPYLRLLGMSAKGQAYLNQRKKLVDIPLITKVNSFHHPILELDKKVANIYALALPNRLQNDRLREEYTQSPIRFTEELKK